MKKLIHMLMALFGVMMLNLQLFANQVQTTLLDGLSAEMKTFYDMTLIDEASSNLVHDQFGQKRPIPKNGGKTIEFRKFAPLAKATTPLTEGVTPDGKSLSVSACGPGSPRPQAPSPQPSASMATTSPSPMFWS